MVQWILLLCERFEAVVELKNLSRGDGQTWIVIIGGSRGIPVL